MDSNATESIVVVGQRQKKRKRKNETNEGTGSSQPIANSTTQAKKCKGPGTSTGEVEPLEAFDFDAAPNILDEPAPDAAPARKRREKGPSSLLAWSIYGAHIHLFFM